ncbi:MAG: glycosyltransferase family 39 protein [Patescibacteria group bacterium]
MKILNNYWFHVCLTGIFVLAVGLRLYKVTAPIADWHSFRQVDTASVAQIFVTRGIDILHPKYHDLSNIQSGKDNPQGYRMVEVPLYQAIATLLVRMVPNLSVDLSLRIITILASSFTALVVASITTTLVSQLAGLSAGVLYAILPFSVFYGRVVLPEPLAVFFAVCSIWLMLFATCVKEKSWAFYLSTFTASISILIKPTVGFLLLPLVGIIFLRYRFSLKTIIKGVILAVVILVPFLWWRQWILQYPEGIPVFLWLLNDGNIRFKGAWFHWLFAERVSKMILGYFGISFVGLGLVLKLDKKEKWVAPLLLFGSILYLVIFAAGNVRHDYYQILLLPVICLYSGKGIAYLFTNIHFSRLAVMILLVVGIGFTTAFSWFTLRTFYWINRPEIIMAGMEADRILPKDAKVIAPYNGDTTFLYQTKRQGWPLGFDIEKKLAQGATHYVTVSPTDADWETKTLAETYTVLVRNDSFAIIDLTKPRQLAGRQK